MGASRAETPSARAYSCAAPSFAQQALIALAEAEQERLRKEGGGRAAAVEAEGKAEAAKIEAIGLAEARAIEAKGLAEAAAILKKAEAWKQFNDAAKLQAVLEKLPSVIEATAPVFAAIAALDARHEPFDLVTLDAELLAADRHDHSGIAYLADLVKNTPSTANIERYARIVAERAGKRRLAAAGNAIAVRLTAKDANGNTLSTGANVFGTDTVVTLSGPGLAPHATAPTPFSPNRRCTRSPKNALSTAPSSGRNGISHSVPFRWTCWIEPDRPCMASASAP
jgi:hypothetical protein